MAARPADDGEEGGVRLGPVFTRLWVATALSDSANGVFRVAASLVVAHDLRCAAAVSAVAAAATLPWLVAAAPVGVLVDTADRRRTLVAANLGRAAVMAGTGLVPAIRGPSVAVLVAAVFVADANGRLALSTRVFYQFSGPVTAPPVRSTVEARRPRTRLWHGLRLR